MPKATAAPPPSPPPVKSEKQRRDDRRASALRANLHRRKAQARGRDAAPAGTAKAATEETPNG